MHKIRKKRRAKSALRGRRDEESSKQLFRTELGRTMNRTKNAMFNREIYEAAHFVDGERGGESEGRREGTKGV